MNRNFNWKGYKWISRQKWGTYHPDHANKWYSPNNVNIDNEGNLVLSISYDPKNPSSAKNFVNEGACDMSKQHIDYACGLCRTEESFAYGTFEIVCNLPCGKMLWPSFWFGSDSAWPPEIDVFEGYSGKLIPYKKWSKNVRVEPNIHYKDNFVHKQVGPLKPSRKFYNFNGFNEFKVCWQPDMIAIYHNGNLVMKETREEVLADFRGKKIHPIINLVVEDVYKKKYVKNAGKLIVKEFKYTPYNKIEENEEENTNINIDA